MPKPKVIIADADASYINPLQLKFVEEFFEEIDLELITQEAYFNELFSTPQKAEALVVSEDFYDSALQRHNIGRIFLMTEQHEEDQTDDLRVNRIFKYTSIKEIFNEITGKCEGLHSKDSKKKECQIILVDSACGGTGKTTVALGISSCLTKNYKRVLYINAGHLQTFQRVLNNQTPVSDANVYAKLSNPTESIYEDIKHVIRNEQFSYLPPFKAAIISLGLSYSVYEKIAIAAKKSNDYDFVIIDTDAVFDDDKASFLNVADKVLVVADQSGASVFATNMLISNINGVNNEKFVFVCNNFDKERDNALISPNLTLRFTINEYIEHIDHFDQLQCEDFSKSSGIQRTAFLVM